ncbi:MAG TPA: hypothetical protein VHQ93_20020 [Chitinophagaceae bacterium]|nr:hypothetical protein [Chitinophagaceae bacterium]
MKKNVSLIITSVCFHYFTYAQPWQWVHAEPNGPAFYTGEDLNAQSVASNADG